ncbi:unnamed protein product [Ceutorhynchus assimilis]|uniref:Ubiquitin-like domain-containing protein n=1 Tax=Ceutorhynchus assimilis TaxID=467358 RepID=A0A9P0DIR0_9CUCU|nr:unnamed protein product [Ceutorhynchus assimilis]
MVYIFFVQPGDMMTFDNEISIMQSVGDLKEKINEKCKIPLEQQVLLINGGEALDTHKNLCSYMAGTDTNPIYLFSTNYDISKLDTLKSLNYDDTDLKERLLDCLSLPVSLSTVRSRTLVAQDFFSVAKEQLEFCESMVHDQHLQQQGWSAVIANLEDIVTEFRKRWELFLKMYEDFIADRDAYDNFLLSFAEDKKTLQRIPVLDALLDSQKELLEGSRFSENATSTSETEASKDISLYEWISSVDRKNSLDELYELCKSNLNKFEKGIMPSLEQQIFDTLQTAEKPERKEIEGLGKRLFDLQELIRKIKKYVEHQSDMAQSFLQNQNSASHMKDTSILPDLCETHMKQLELIKICHQKLMDDRNRIVRAKYELSKSLCARIGWVQNVEDKLWELDSLLVYFHEHLQRLRKHLEVFQQLHLAPSTYMNAVVEVVRRRSFSQTFLLWASDLACQQMTIHNEELTRRKEFGSQFDGHFLNALFPGMGDVPPAFAIEAPSVFDAKLPNISEEDIEKLKKLVPDFAENLTVPDMNHIISFFMGKISATKGKEDKVDDAKGVEDKLIQAVSDVGLASYLDKNLLKATGGSEPCLVSAPGLQHCKDDRGCESETDTEEFEKVGQSPLELIFPKIAEKQDASTSTEDNLQISRSEHEKLKNSFLSLSIIAKQVTKNLRTELNEFKSQFVHDSQLLCKHYEDFGSSWNSLILETNRNEKEIVESMQRQNNDDKEQYRYNLLEKEDFIRRLEEDKRAVEDRLLNTFKQKDVLEERLSESANKVDELLRQLQENYEDKEKCLKELTENLRMEHRAELDNIKSRFRLMTMERSPSLTSLEREKSGDFSSLPGHTTLLVQMTENFELDKEKAVAEERQRWETILEEKTNELQQKYQEDKEIYGQDIAKRVSEDKDKQIDILREREKNLNLEIIKHKTTIQQLAEYQQDKMESELYEQIEALKQENKNLQEQLVQLRERQESVEFLSKPDLTSPSESLEMTKSDTVSARLPNLNIDSCKIGDIVLVIWDQYHKNFKILQESKHAYFLHSECLDKLGLSLSDGKPNKLHCTGEVLAKELCQTQKSNNRFNVPIGTKFFLVKVKPLMPSDLAQSHVTELPDRPEELLARSVEKQFAEDSGIVDNVEQAMSATEDTYRLKEETFWSAQDNDKLSQEKEKSPCHSLESLQSKITVQKSSQFIEEDKKDQEEMTLLKQEKKQLEEELAKIKSEKEALTTSVALHEGKLDATTSPLALSPPTSDLSRSEIVSSSRPHRLNIDSCKIGDIVLLLWDPAHENYKVLQESKHTYFLHSDSIDKLGLSITDSIPNKLYCTGEVVDKEYCQTRKSENRYKVPKGAKFFRVKVKPIVALRDSKDLIQSSYSTRQSTSMSTSQSVIATFDPLIEEPRASTSVTIPEEELGANKHFVEDSGIEEATVAIEHSDRFEADECKEVVEQSTNWLEAMFRSMFSK